MKFIIFTPEAEQTNESLKLKRISERNNLSCRYPLGKFWNQNEGGGAQYEYPGVNSSNAMTGGFIYMLK